MTIAILPVIAGARLRGRGGVPPAAPTISSSAGGTLTLPSTATAAPLTTLSLSGGATGAWSITTNVAGNKLALGSPTTGAASVDVNVPAANGSTSSAQTVQVQCVVDGSGAVVTWNGTVQFTAAAGDATLMTLTLSGDASGAKTNEPIQVAIPLGPSDLTAGRTLRVYDDNGSGAKGSVLANFQVTDISTDLASAPRLAVLTGIVPSLASGGTRKLFVETTTTAAPTGTAITAADILATSFAAELRFDIGGTTYTFDVRAALAASATFSKTDYLCVVRSSGPCCTSIFLAGPPKNGGSAHASGDGLRVCAELVAFKAGTGAVGGGNSITLVEGEVWVENADAARASPVHYWYGLTLHRATSLSSGTLITTDDTDVDGNVRRYDFPRTASPTGNLTLSSASIGTGRTITRSTGTWPTDAVGAHIRDASGGAVITSRDSTTQVTAYVYQAMGGTSISSGSWSYEGVGHHYGVVLPPLRFQVGTKRTSRAIFGDTASAITPDSRAPLSIVTAAKLLPAMSVTYASVTHTMTDLNLMRSADSTRRPGTFRGGEGSYMGDVFTDISPAGLRPDIGYMSLWGIEGLAKCDANGRRKIRENAEYFGTWQYGAPPRLSGSPSNGSLGCPPRADGGVAYSWNGSTGVTTLAVPAVTWWPYDRDTGHHSHTAFAAYLIDPRIYWLRTMDRQQELTCSLEANNISTDYGNGSGINCTPYGDASNTISYHMGGMVSQTRAKAWSFRDLAQHAIALPDALPALICGTKSYVKTRIEKTWLAAYNYGPNDTRSKHPGTGKRVPWIFEEVYAELGPQFTNETEEAGFQLNYTLFAWGAMKLAGLTDSNGDAAYAWLTMLFTDYYSAGAVYRDILPAVYFMLLKEDAEYATYPASVAELYARNALKGPADSGLTGLIYRGYYHSQPTGTLTLSAASVGSGRTFTFSASYFSAGSWYVGGYIKDRSSGGIAKITSVTSGTVVTCDIIVAFGSTTPSISNISLPGYAPADYTNQLADLTAWGTVRGTIDYGYIQAHTAALRIADANGIAGAGTAAAYQAARTGYAETYSNFAVSP